MNFKFKILNFKTELLCICSITALCLPLIADAALARDLKIGMRGADVKELQIFLNRDADTIVSPVGPGSSGKETEYFGPATKRAVIRFQEKYRTDVLDPVGLSSGSGFVGSLTRQKISTLKGNSSMPSLPSSSVTKPIPTESPVAPEKTATPTVTPRYDFEAFLSSIRSVGLAQGLSEEQLKEIESMVRVEAEKQEYGKNFIPELEKNQIKISTDSPGGKIAITLGISNFIQESLNPFAPKTAHAISGTPFGGRVLFPFLCTCSGNWLVTLMPLPPTYAVLLTYYMGTQAYLNFTSPFTLNMVGEYTQGGQCQIFIGLGCASVPNQGQITSTLGSS